MFHGFGQAKFADAVENGLDVRSFVQRLIVAEIVAGAWKAVLVLTDLRVRTVAAVELPAKSCLMCSSFNFLFVCLNLIDKND